MVAHWPRLVKIMIASNKLWFLVFCLTDLVQTSLTARSSEVIMSAKAGEICDMKHDVLLVEDTSSDSSYLQCLPVGRGLGAFWERIPCQPGQKFFFTEQKCDNNSHQKSQKPLTSSASPPTSPETTTTVTPTISSISSTESLSSVEIPTAATIYTTDATSTATAIIYASLYENCANGERCEMGTICDSISRLCSCPHGLVNVPGTKICDFAPTTTTTFAPYSTSSTTVVEETTTETEPISIQTEPTPVPTVPVATTKKYSIALELFTQDMPLFTYPIQKLISPGSSCKNAEANCGGGSFCNADNYVCSCPTETVDDSGVCIHIKVSAGINERCDGHTKCTGWSTCIGGVCRCQPPLLQNGNQCLPIGGLQLSQQESKPNQPCDKGQMCLGGSMCSTVSLTCTCPVGSHNIGDTCVSLSAATPTNSSIGHRCNLNTDCIKGAYCSAVSNPPSCQCLSTNVFINEACFKIINPGQKGCDLDEQCSAAYQGARCSMGTCICPNGYAAKSETCKPVILNPGDDCRNSEACSGGSACFQNVCVCPLGYVALSETCVFVNHTKSHHSVAIGEKCTNKTKSFCMSGSQCTNGICQCPFYTIVVNDTCQPVNPNDTNEALFFPLELGMFLVNMTQVENPYFVETHCKSDEVPTGCDHNEICNNGICDCVEGFIRVNSVCRFKYVKVGDACHKHQICLGGSECFASVCTCLPGLKNLGGKCLAGINKFKIDCPVGTTLVGSHCQNLTQEDIVALDTFCTDNRQCGRGFICSNHKCECPPGTHKKLNQCWRNPGGSCSNGEVCDGCSVCLRDACTCSGNVAPVNGICPTNIARPNERCNTGQCCIGASECMQGICTCPEGTRLLNLECSNIGTTSPPFGPCDKNQMCIGGSKCSNGLCMCPSDQLVLSNQCQLPPVVNPAPGEPCNHRTDQCTSGSTCERGVCVCPPGQYPIEKVCIPNIPGIPGDSCTDIDRCVPGVLCMYGMCQCPEKQMWSTDRCIAVSEQTEPGAYCSSNQQCLGGSNCQNGRCTCSTDQVVVNAECKTRLVSPNEQCQPPQECTGNSQCSQGYCLCSANSIPVNGVCILAFPQPGDSCNPAFSQCSGGSSCNLGVCTCPQGQEAVNGDCASGQIIAQPGQFCDPSDYLCTGSSSCINNKCTCNAEFVIINSQCKPKKIPPNSNCHSAQQCTGGSQCLEGSCLCPANFIASSTGTCISVQPAPGEICDLNFSVCRGGSVCIHSKCTCQQGMSIVNEICSTGPPLLTAKPNEFCDPRSFQCTGGALCLNGLCTCPINNLPIDSVCQNVNPLPFQPCRSPQICAGGATCIEGICICPAGKLAINNACHGIPPPGEKCSADVPLCGGGAICTNSICSCPNGNAPVHRKCNTANHGQFCSEDSYHCLDGSKCKGNVCTCPVGKVLSNSKCLDKHPTPGSACLQQQPCSGGAVCIQSICRCQPGFIPGSNDKCIPFSGNPNPNEHCTPSQTCTGGSNCINSLCQCPNNGHPIGNICQGTSELAVPGKPCKSGQVCVGGSTCTNGVCICPPNQISKGPICEFASGNNVASGGACTSKAQCGGGTMCINGRCMCPVNSIVYSNQCISRQVNAGGSCILFVQTCLGGSRCLGSICVCPQNQVARNGVCGIRASYFVHSIALQDSKFSNAGERCNAKLTNCFGGSKCIDGICMCPRGFRKYKEKCVRYSPSHKPPGSWCANDDQCSGRSICKNSACICSSNMSVVEGECTVLTNKTFINGSCLLTGQCMDGLTCLFGICQCLNNTRCQGMGHFTSPPGGSCAALQRCSGGSVCRSGWCTCPEATMIVINGFCLVSNNETTSQPDAEEVVSDYEEESSATDDLPNPIDTSQNQQPSAIAGQATLSGGQSSINVGQPPLNRGQPFVSVGQPSPNRGQTSFNSGQPSVIGGQSSIIGGQPGVNRGQISFNVGQPPLNGFQPPPGFGQSQLNINSLQSLPQSSLGLVPRSPSLGFSSESGSTSIGMGSLMTNSNFTSLPFGSSNVPNASVPKPTKVNNYANSKQFARPGVSCSPSSVCTGGSKCILGMCLCDDQFQIIGQICVRQVPPIRASPPMGSCQNGEPCTGGAICDGQICQCLPGTELKINLCQPQQQMPTTVAITRSAMPIIVVPPMANCASGERCGGNSMCNRVTYICECPGDLQPMQGHCVHLINKNRTPIQNSPNPPAELTQIPVASAWKNPSNSPFGSGKSEIYQPTIYSMGIPNNAEVVQGPSKSSSLQNSKLYAQFLPSLTNQPVNMETVNGKAQPGGFPLPPTSILTKIDYNANNIFNTGFTPFATGAQPTSGTSSNLRIDTLPPSHSASSMTSPETSGEAVEASISAPPNSQCGRGRACTGGSFCVHFKCRCPEGTAANEFDMCQKAVSSSGTEIQGVRLGGQCNEEKICAGTAVCISGRCRCPANTLQDGPVCISLKESGKQRFFSAPIMHAADAVSICPKGAEPGKEPDGEKYIQCDASRPSSCPWGWYCYATDKALENGPYFCCPTF